MAEQIIITADQLYSNIQGLYSHRRYFLMLEESSISSFVMLDCGVIIVVVPAVGVIVICNWLEHTHIVVIYYLQARFAQVD